MEAPPRYDGLADWYDERLADFTLAASDVIVGGVCEGGISCTGNRDLYDDFGVAASDRPAALLDPHA